MNVEFMLWVTLATAGLTLASEDPAAEHRPWSRKSDMPTARFGCSASVVEGRIYVIGGTQEIRGTYLPTVEQYDPATDRWTKKADMPTARIGHAASVVKDKIYILGGAPVAGQSIDDVAEYDPAADTWSVKAAMPTKRTFHCACAVNGRVYVFGGLTAGVPGAALNPLGVEVYDPAKNAWATRGNIPTPRCCAGAGVVDAKIFVAGGVTGGLHDLPIPVVEMYDPAAGSWTRKADMPTPRMLPAVAVLRNRIYAIGGGTWPNQIRATMEEYDPKRDVWANRVEMALARTGLAACVVRGKIYAIGGTSNWYPGAPFAMVEAFGP